MDGNNVSSDQVIAEMLEMGFEYSNIVEAIKIVGPSITSAVDHIFNGAGGATTTTSFQAPSTSTAHTSKFHANNGKSLKRRPLPSFRQVRQSRILDHFQSTDDKVTECKNNDLAVDATCTVEEEHKEPSSVVKADPIVLSGSLVAGSPEDLDIASDWEKKVSIILQKHFGFSSLKSFQKKALSAWVAHKDCLVLAATGSGFYSLALLVCA